MVVVGKRINGGARDRQKANDEGKQSKNNLGEY